MGALKKDLKILTDYIAPYGYKLVKGKGHSKIVDSQGRYLLTISSSPSDRNWWRHAIQALKKYGYCK